MRILLILALLAGLAHGQTVTSVSASSNGTLQKPLNFFSANGIPTLAGNNTFLGNNTFSLLNIGTSDYGWTYNPAGGGQIELRFPGGTAAFYETGTPKIPYMYFPGSIQADYISGSVQAVSLNADSLVGFIPSQVVTNSLIEPLRDWWGDQEISSAAGIVWDDTGPFQMMEPTPAGGFYWPGVEVIDGGEDNVNTLQGRFFATDDALDTMGAARLNAAGNTFGGNVTVQGSTTLGDAAGDTLAVGGSNPATAPLGVLSTGEVVANAQPAAPTETAVLTKQYGDANYKNGLGWARGIARTKEFPTGTGWTTATNGSGSAVSNTSALASVSAGVSAGSYAIQRIVSNRYIGIGQTEFPDNFTPWRTDLGFVLVGDFVSARPGQALRILWGGATSDVEAATYGSLFTTGLGIEINTTDGTNHFIRLLTWENNATVVSSYVAFSTSITALWVYYNRSGSNFTVKVFDIKSDPPVELVSRIGVIDDSPVATRGFQFVACNDGSPASPAYFDFQKFVITTNAKP